MINGERVLAVIPARSGSKRCPRKNIRNFRGVPLFIWSINASLNSRYVDRTIVSSDSWEILIACSLSAQWSGTARDRLDYVERPAELATDEATNEDVLRHVLGIIPSAAFTVLLQPTSPHRVAADIDSCIEIAQEGNACISYRPDGTKNGAVYVARSSWLLEGHNFSEDTLRYIMPTSRSLDIDYPEQFE